MIMIVDDNKDITKILDRFLKIYHYDVIVANGGKEALEKMSNDVDLIISDMNMPGMSGMDLYYLVTKKYPKMKMMFMSGNFEKYKEVYDIGDTIATINKPFEFSVFLKKMKALMEK